MFESSAARSPGMGRNDRCKTSSQVSANAGSILAIEEAQVLVEHALAFGVVALGAGAGMNAIANSVNDRFIVVTNIFTEALTRS